VAVRLRRITRILPYLPEMALRITRKITTTLILVTVVVMVMVIIVIMEVGREIRLVTPSVKISTLPALMPVRQKPAMGATYIRIISLRKPWVNAVTLYG
jgi:hypothetical protein